MTAGCGEDMDVLVIAVNHDEIVPVVIKGKKGDTVFDTDEGFRPV